MGCEPKMKERPPLRASSMANSGPDTDCIIAETKGMFNSIADCVPRLYFTNGVRSETLEGTHCLVVRPGISKYSPKVLETSST